MTITEKQKRYCREHRGLVLFILLMLGFRSAWADWVTVPSGSMNPTILEGDRVLVDKHVFGLRLPFTLIRLTAGADPARGDIVVFDSPANGQSLVKRVAAVPGDVLELDGETLIINGQPAHYRAGDLAHLKELLSTTAAESPMVLSEDSGGINTRFSFCRHAHRSGYLGRSRCPRACISCWGTIATTVPIPVTSGSYPGDRSSAVPPTSSFRSIRSITSCRGGIASSFLSPSTTEASRCGAPAPT